MEQQNNQSAQQLDRRERLHELVIALISQRELDLMDVQAPSMDCSAASTSLENPARWLDRNKRVLKSYQALVRSAVTLDALLDAELQSSS